MPVNPHLQIEPVRAGAPLDRCTAAAVLVHGRDQDQEVMLDVVARLGLEDVAYLLPVAAGRSWYDGRYFDPVATLQPQLDHALAALQAAIERLRAAGIPQHRIVLGGFSQGACLVADLVAGAAPTPAPLVPERPVPARSVPERLMGAAILTGSLIGPPHARTRPAALGGLPIYISSSRYDEWIDFRDAQATADAFKAAGAAVRFEPLEEHEHLISDTAVAGLRALLARRER